jgi:hypothetical protein
MPVILVTWEAEIRRVHSLREIVRETPISKIARA